MGSIQINTDVIDLIIGNKKLLEYSSRSLVPAGENYGGIIAGVHLVYVVEEDEKNKEQDVVLKFGPANEMFCEMFNINFTFKREMEMYLGAIPKLEEFSGHTSLHFSELFPKCYGARLNNNNNNNSIVDENSVIVLEDLTVAGFKLYDRMKGFDRSNSILILKSLARFHSVPIALKHLRGEEEFESTVLAMKPASFGDSFSEKMKRDFLKAMAEIIDEIPECAKRTSKVIDLVDAGFKFEERFYMPNTNFTSLVHHDLWTNNILVNEETAQVKFIDLQMLCCGSIFHDLVFFLLSSVEQHVINEEFDYLVRVYYDELIKSLGEFEINADSFSWRDFIREMNEIAPHQFSHVAIMLRPFFVERGKIDDMAQVGEDELVNLRKLNPGYKKKLRDTILFFADKQWI